MNMQILKTLSKKRYRTHHIQMVVRQLRETKTLKQITMNRLFVIILTFWTCYGYGQDKYDFINYNRLTEIKGTEYVINTIENRGKMETKSKYLLFINTLNGKTKQIDFPKDSYIEKIEQIKIDSLGINKILIIAKTVNLDNKKGIDWNDPKQIMILSTDGQQKIQLTDDNFFVNSWIINRYSGAIVITGYYDTNPNGKYDKKDKNGISIFDIKTLKLIKRI